MNLHPIGTAVRWLGSLELGVLVAFAIVAGGTWGFVELADEVLEGETQAFDERVLRAMRDPNDLTQPRGPNWFVEVARDVTALGGYFFLTFTTVSVAIFLGLERKYSSLTFLLGAVIGGYIMMRILKELIDRPRPAVIPHLSAAPFPSFPSGHSMMSAIAFLTLGALLSRLETTRPLKIYFLSMAVFLTLIVGLSRIYMGVHYPTDVLAGWTCGFVWAALCALAVRWLQSRRKLDTEL